MFLDIEFSSKELEIIRLLVYGVAILGGLLIFGLIVKIIGDKIKAIRASNKRDF